MRIRSTSRKLWSKYFPSSIAYSS